MTEQARRRIHFSGIGGTAMVAGARLAIEAGWEVRGSDNPLYPPTSAMVAELGVPVAAGYAAENLDWQPDVVLLGNVLSRGNPEVEAALSRRMRFMSLPEWLKEQVLRPRRPVVIAGTHGKTTTTALTAHVLTACGLDPGYLIGGQPLGLPHAARLGPEGAPFVIEGDEYDTAFFDKRAKFLHYLPEIAVVTSIEFDHGDIYRDLAEIDVAFQRMLRQIPREGWLVVCGDNRAAEVLREAPCRVATYGFGPGLGWQGILEHGPEGRMRMQVLREGRPFCTVSPTLAGKHNFQNTLAAVAVAGILGASPETIEEGVAGFAGVRRRMEVFLEAGGRIFIDDFAHHPTAIRETIAAARSRWPRRPLWVLFEPRSNTTVTRTYQDDLAVAFSGADAVWLGPIYRAERIPELERLDRATLCRRLEAGGMQAGYTDHAQEIAEHVLSRAPAEAVVLILSNGAFGGIYDYFREKAEA